MPKVRAHAAMSSIALSTCLSCLLLLQACSSERQQQPAADSQATAEAAIRLLDAGWVKAAQSKSVDGWMGFYADDAAVLPPNEPVANSKEAIRKSVTELLTAPGLAISWQPTKIEVAKAGDLAYLYGTYQDSWTGTDGKQMSDHGKMVEIWKKQLDGSWKCVLDTWNSDVPAAPATSK